MNGLIELFESFKTYGNRPAMIYRSGIRRTSYSRYAEIHTPEKGQHAAGAVLELMRSG